MFSSLQSLCIVLSAIGMLAVAVNSDSVDGKCFAVPNNLAEQNDTQCAICGPPKNFPYWPCNQAKPHICYGECGVIGNVTLETAMNHTICYAVPGNKPEASNTSCHRCAPSINHQHWPCTLGDEVCQGECIYVVGTNETKDLIDTNETIITSNETGLDYNATCFSIPMEEGNDISDISCAACGPPHNHKYWPCDIKPIVCYGECGPVLGNVTLETAMNRSICYAVPGNKPMASNVSCQKCIPSENQYQHWPCTLGNETCQGDCVYIEATEKVTKKPKVTQKVTKKPKVTQKVTKKPEIVYNVTVSGCFADPRNDIQVTDKLCQECKDGRLYWPCNEKPSPCYGVCGDLIDNPKLLPTPPQACFAIKGNKANIVDSQCAICGPPQYFKWWPCNIKPTPCEGVCKMGNAPESATEDFTEESDNGSLATILIPIVVVAALVVVAAVFFYQRRNEKATHKCESEMGESAYKKMSI